MRRHHWLLAAIVLLGLWAWSQRLGNNGVDTSAPAPATRPAPAGQAPTAPARHPAFLPPEAQPVLAAIARGGPYAYRQDGGVFHNREGRLPAQPRGYYREFTVDTPGSPDRGPRRIVTGGQPPREYWYSDDHYRSFRRFTVAPAVTTP